MKKFLSLLVAALLIAACSGPEKRAQALLDQASRALEADSASLALELLDSLDSSCREAVDIRREGMALRARAQEQLSVRELAVTDSLLLVNTIRLDSLSGMLRNVSNAVEAFSVVSPSTVDDPVSVRMSPEGVLYLNLRLSGNPARLTLSAGEETLTVPLPSDPELNLAIAGGRQITLMGSAANDLAAFVRANAGAAAVTLNGKALSSSQRTALANASSLGETRALLDTLSARHRCLEAVLMTARNHSARASEAAGTPAGDNQ